MALHKEDEEIYKDILLGSLDQAIEDDHLEHSLLPALLMLNHIPGVITVSCCEGHPCRNVYSAHIDLNLSKRKWSSLQTNVERVLGEGGLARVEFHYDQSEEGVQRTARLVTHPNLVRERSLPSFTRAAHVLELLHKGASEEVPDVVSQVQALLRMRGTSTSSIDLGFSVAEYDKELEGLPTECATCGSPDIKILYYEVGGKKIVNHVECFACQKKADMEKYCPNCWARPDGPVVNTVREDPDAPGTFICPHCDRRYVKGDGCLNTPPIYPV